MLRYGGCGICASNCKTPQKNQAFPGLSGTSVSVIFTTTIGAGAAIKMCFKKSSVQEKGNVGQVNTSSAFILKG
jgi:hypothetical protein